MSHCCLHQVPIFIPLLFLNNDLFYNLLLLRIRLFTCHPLLLLFPTILVTLHLHSSSSSSLLSPLILSCLAAAGCRLSFDNDGLDLGWCLGAIGVPPLDDLLDNFFLDHLFLAPRGDLLSNLLYSI